MAAKALAGVGRPGQALEVARTITIAKHRLIAMGTIAVGQAKRGENAGAVGLVKMALSEARTLGRVAVFQVIGDCTNAIYAVDSGETLWAIFNAVIEVDGWWNENETESVHAHADY